jgi:spermidine synthase
MRRFYLFFFLSGFCSLLYELIWLRLAVARFGVTTNLVATFLAVFMSGLGAGSWLAGRWVRKHLPRLRFSTLYLYSITELLIGCGAVAVPFELVLGHRLIVHLGSHVSLSSVAYYFVSGIWLWLTLFPWCACMGATFPFAMAAIEAGPERDARSFSFLYLANVLGATAGAVFPLLLIEKVGFSATLKIGALLNLVVFVAAWLTVRSARTSLPPVAAAPQTPPPATVDRRFLLLLLFGTGLTSMGMELLWVRMFTPAIGTMVYSFALILATYLMATFLGTRLYRRWRAPGAINSLFWTILGFAGLLPLLSSDILVPLSSLLRLILGIAPFALAAGFATPMLVDKFSSGNADRAGSAYAANVLGCVIGPLLSGYFLLPLMSERWALVVFAAPWFVLGLVGSLREKDTTEAARSQREKEFAARPLLISLMLTAVAVVVFAKTKDYEARIHSPIVLRDPTATVTLMGKGRDRRLLVNGVGMSGLTPVTKLMAHLPLAFQGNPRSALVICFGMGTTHRAMLSWGIDSTAVELVPSVPKLFPYFHQDAASVLSSPRSRVIIDDGRRYLEWSRDQYDVIAIDPPPPVEAAGSSLLYSTEFYALAKKHLRPGGILQQWIPGADAATYAAVARALQNSFPYVRAFRSIADPGVHFLASEQAIPMRSAAELAQRLPPAAARDLVEWGPYATPEQQFEAILHNEFPVADLVQASPWTPAMRDDRPTNEYLLLRRARAK